jgi:hypothetical protein
MRVATRLMIVSVCALSAAPALIRGQSAAGSPVSVVNLEAMRQLRDGVDAWPLIANPSTAAQQRINATLTRLNQRMQKSLAECDANYADWAKQDSQNDANKSATGDWERKINVTMAGSGFLSMVAIDSQFCGGAYPNADTLALVFDLGTGKPLNWMRFIAPSAGAKPSSDTIYDGTTVGTLIVTSLLQISKSKADADCKEAFQNSQSYQLWPDAKSGTLIAEPFGLPHVVAACAEDLSLTLDQARKMGFDGALLGAIEQAHRDWIAASHSGKK